MLCLKLESKVNNKYGSVSLLMTPMLHAVLYLKSRFMQVDLVSKLSNAR